jgi:hypothetical protein
MRLPDSDESKFVDSRRGSRHPLLKSVKHKAKKLYACAPVGDRLQFVDCPRDPSNYPSLQLNGVCAPPPQVNANSSLFYSRAFLIVKCEYIHCRGRLLNAKLAADGKQLRSVLLRYGGGGGGCCPLRASLRRQSDFSRGPEYALVLSSSVSSVFSGSTSTKEGTTGDRGPSGVVVAPTIAVPAAAAAAARDSGPNQ